MADRSSDPQALQREIERSRQELARTIDELADRVNPRNVAQRGAERLKEEAEQVRRTVDAAIRVPDEDGRPGPIDPRLVMAGVGVVVGMTVFAMMRRRSRKRRSRV
ncbi:DUF3618 domain-containing protein [Actinomadura logoneensis]|uniref:DUF3618 domain-containing protein n=1 Tax=Actinomadura logoneensis TaxID=2293572 RepID=A0A372J982_9ACTN|nr:DUF3618 domain-containing protein [Actinomadura logoneensis]RFU36550.1 DUF3618 domain-containing protein [Actinomadura logoneensis]